MKLPDAHSEEEWVDERIEPYVDGELEPEEKQVMDMLLQQNPEYHKRVEAAKTLLLVLGDINIPECPPDITRQVSLWVLLDAFQQSLARLYQSVLVPAWKPAMAVAVMVCAIWFAIQLNPTTGVDTGSLSQAQSEEEVDQALNEIKFALGYVSRAGREAGASVQLAIDPLRPEDSEK